LKEKKGYQEAIVLVRIAEAAVAAQEAKRKRRRELKRALINLSEPLLSR